MRMWGGRFDEGPDERMADFTRSIDIDSELAVDDIAGSIAHVRGLERAGLLSDDEASALERGLVSLRADVEAGAIAWDPALEDVHMNLETMLTERVGAVGGKLHTGPSSTSRSARATPSSRARRTSSRRSPCSSPITCWPTSRCSSGTAAASSTRGGP